MSIRFKVTAVVLAVCIVVAGAACGFAETSEVLLKSAMETKAGMHQIPANFDEILKKAQNGDVDAQNEAGFVYYWQRNYAEASKWFLKAAGQGNAEAFTHLGGVYYIYGFNNPAERTRWYKEAVRWFEMASELSDAYGLFNLGYMYYTGQGVKKDDAEAVRWFKMSAEQGYAQAQNNLGVCYEQGKGVPQNYSEAMKWFRRAAEQESDNKLYNIALDRDYSYAVIAGQYNLGNMYYKGEGVPVNYDEALKWFRKAAAQGHYAAQELAGEIEGRSRYSNSSVSSEESSSSYSYLDIPSQPLRRICPDCGGSGKKVCTSCSGAGGRTEYISVPNYSGSTRHKSSFTWVNCSWCHGSGSVFCTNCGGSGYIW